MKKKTADQIKAAGLSFMIMLRRPIKSYDDYLGQNVTKRGMREEYLKPHQKRFAECMSITARAR